MIPAEFVVPTCDTCFAPHLRDEDVERLTPTWDRMALEAAELHWRRNFNARAPRMTRLFNYAEDLPTPETNDDYQDSSIIAFELKDEE